MSPGFMDRNNNNNEPVMGPLSWKLGAIIIFGSNIKCRDMSYRRLGKLSTK